MPTNRGVALLVSAAGFYFQARLFGVDELHGVAAACLVFPVAAIVFVRWSRHRIAFRRRVGPKRVFAGGTVRISVTAKNEARIPSPPLRVRDAAPHALGGSVVSAIPSLPGGATTEVATQRTAAGRGAFTIGPLRATITDPFGLAQIGAEVASASTLMVYPAIEHLGEDAPPETRGAAGRSAIHRIATSGDEFYGVRPWEHGDDLRKIHWRSTAKRDQVMIRQDEVHPFPHATIFVDTREAVHRRAGAASSMEWAIAGAASVVWELARQGFALRLGTADSGPGGSRWGREAADPLLGSLAQAEPALDAAIGPALRRLAAGPGASGALIAIMPPPSPDVTAQLARLTRSYTWCGAILVDAVSFAGSRGRERAAFDQRLAGVERRLARAGWRVAVAGSKDRFRGPWNALLAGASRPSSALPRS